MMNLFFSVGTEELMKNVQCMNRTENGSTPPQKLDHAMRIKHWKHRLPYWRKTSYEHFRCCQISSDKTPIIWKICDWFYSNNPDNILYLLFQRAKKSHGNLFIKFLKNKYFIYGNLATFESSYGVSPQHGSEELSSKARGPLGSLRRLTPGLSPP